MFSKQFTQLTFECKISKISSFKYLKHIKKTQPIKILDGHQSDPIKVPFFLLRKTLTLKTQCLNESHVFNLCSFETIYCFLWHYHEPWLFNIPDFAQQVPYINFQDDVLFVLAQQGLYRGSYIPMPFGSCFSTPCIKNFR